MTSRLEGICREAFVRARNTPDKRILLPNMPEMLLLSDELWSCIFLFLAPHPGGSAGNDSIGVRSIILSCKRFKQIIYHPKFWQGCFSAPCRIGQSIELAAAWTFPRAYVSTLQFNGFRKVRPLWHSKSGERRIHVIEHTSGKNLVISVTLWYRDHTVGEGRRFLRQLITVRRMRLCYRDEGCINQRAALDDNGSLVYIRCISFKFHRRFKKENYQLVWNNAQEKRKIQEALAKQGNRFGHFPDQIRAVWQDLLDWIFELSTVKTEYQELFFPVANLLQTAYMNSADSFSSHPPQVVAAAATYIAALLSEESSFRSFRRQDFFMAMDNRCGMDGFWQCAKILIALHADDLDNPSLQDCYVNPHTEITQHAKCLLFLAAISTLIENYSTLTIAHCVRALIDLADGRDPVDFGTELPLSEAHDALYDASNASGAVTRHVVEVLMPVYDITKLLPSVQEIKAYQRRLRT